MEPLKQPLTNVQLEILKAFSYNLDNKELSDLKQLLANYFAQRATQKANEVWDEKGWTDEDVDRMLKIKMRNSKK